MIQRSTTMDIEVREKMKGGKGEVSVTHLLKPIQMKGKCRFVGKMVIQPGCSIGEHIHDKEEEIYYIMSGTGMVVDNGIRQEVHAGDVILTGDGAAHSIENTGNGPLVVMGFILLY